MIQLIYHANFAFREPRALEPANTMFGNIATAEQNVKQRTPRWLKDVTPWSFGMRGHGGLMLVTLTNANIHTNDP